MKNKLMLLGFCLVGVMSFSQNQKPSEIFWENLTKHCGKAYEGKLADHITRDEFVGKKLVMHVKSCTKDVIKVPFYVGDDRSRTWVLTKKDGVITLKHDHRHEDGSHDKVTNYGGTSSNYGMKNAQFFPADQETATLIDYASTNIWWITLDDKTYSYNLQRVGSKSPFNVFFDLTKEVEKPLAPWGWKD